MESNQLSFTFSPRLLILLGEQLIKDDVIAITELIKNSYDADASKVELDFKNLELGGQLAKITVKDNGSGMDYDTVKNIWLRPGTNNKSKQFKKKELTKLYKRLPLGEKGIGRLGAHKIGSEIKIITRMEGKREICFSIDWNKFEMLEDINDVKIQIEEREAPEIFKTNTGTQITMKGLKEEWSKSKFRKFYLQIMGLQNPFHKLENFEIQIDNDNKKWLKDIINFKDIEEFKLYEFDIKIEGDKMTKFDYKLLPWKTFKKIKKKHITIVDMEPGDVLLKDVTSKKNIGINIGAHEIGPIEFKGFVFDFDPQILDLHPNRSLKADLKKVLAEIGGFRVYRDGFRIYNYGEQGSDLLNLNLRRVNQPSMRISENIIVGSVNLSREHSADLKEKTNREGFIENDAFKLLKKALTYSLAIVERYRFKDKDLIRTLELEQKNEEPVKTKLNALKDNLSLIIKDEKQNKKIQHDLDMIQKEFEHITSTLLKGASNGLTLSIVVHELEKILMEMQRYVAISADKVPNKLVNLIGHLRDTVFSYTKIIKGKSKKNIKISEIIDDALFNIEYRLRCHETTIKLFSFRL